MADANIERTEVEMWIFTESSMRMHLSPIMPNQHTYSRLCQISITRNSRSAIPARNYTSPRMIVNQNRAEPVHL